MTTKTVQRSASPEVFLTFRNMEAAIAQHLDTHAVRLDVRTRRFLADIRDAAGAQAEHLRADLWPEG